MTLKTLLTIIEPKEVIEIIDEVTVYNSALPFQIIEKEYLNRKVKKIKTKTLLFDKFSVLKIYLERKE
jgi:hypothetical protein